MDISKKDWKLFRERLSGWQEKYMEGLVKEYANFLNDDKKPASEKFWELEKRIKEDKRHPGVIMELSSLETVAPHWHESVARYKRNGGTEKLKKYDYTSYDDDTPYYTMIIREDGHKIKLLLDLNEELLHAMKTQCPGKVYFA